MKAAVSNEPQQRMRNHYSEYADLGDQAEVVGKPLQDADRDGTKATDLGVLSYKPAARRQVENAPLGTFSASIDRAKAAPQGDKNTIVFSTGAQSGETDQKKLEDHLSVLVPRRAAIEPGQKTSN